MDQRADQPRLGGVERGDQVRAAFGAVDLLVDALEDLLDLLVQFGAVGDDQHAGIGDVLPNPFGEPDHDQALAAALGVPDDAALAPLHDSWAARTPKYWLWRQSFLIPASKTMKSWISSRKRALPQSCTSARSSGFSMALVFLPRQVILLRRLDRAVAQALGVVARHDQLHRGEEGLG